MAEPTTLYLLRHGQTAENAVGVFQGQRPGTLTARGVWQAVAARAEVARLPFEAVLCSDLDRTVRTAGIVLNCQPGSASTPDGRPIAYTPLLRERDMGRLTGRPIAGAALDESVENTAQCSARARDFLAMVRRQWPGRRLLIVSHGHFLRVLMAVAVGKEVWQMEKMDNCDIRTIELD